jgi:hypothetical protein
MHKATPILIVDRIEDVLPFWKAIGLEPSVQVPDEAFEDSRLAFAILSSGNAEIMYQTTASFRADIVRSATLEQAFALEIQQVSLYVEVESIEAVETAMDRAAQVMCRRQTRYGATEVAYRDPAGNVIIFAHRGGD